mmetsp:Transcript_30100/g.36771  ORF Transcript_30100/g.36771 Transcript_30100/m.36771 type:complete len:275 (+) Transcript_30100:207-1031(+)
MILPHGIRPAGLLMTIYGIVSIPSSHALTTAPLSMVNSNTKLMSRRNALLTVPAAAATLSAILPSEARAAISEKDNLKIRRYPQTRFIAALGDPSASEGTGAEKWGLWRDDPGPRGVYLRNYDDRLAPTGVAPAGWTFREDEGWWLEEHGLIMSSPEELPRKKYDRATERVLPYKRYVVTGDREVTTVLTVFEDGRWELGKGSLYDVTHLPCRSAKYVPRDGAVAASNGGNDGMCSPRNANRRDFPVKPGASMPDVSGCVRQDYAVLFVLGEEA